MIARRVAEGLAEYGLISPMDAVLAPDETLAPARTLSLYCDLLLRGNEKMNLTAITDPEQVAELHMLDCAALLTVADFTGQPAVIDVGTGAGFPGLVLKVLEPGIRLTLLDSLGKRVEWLSQVAPFLGVPDVACIHGRGEEQAHHPALRDHFDFAVSRAVAELSLLTELCLPFVKVGGKFLAMKGPDCQGELEAAGRAISLLGGQVCPPVPYRIPGTELRRQVVVVEKVSPTPKGYPRRYARMKKKPL